MAGPVGIDASTLLGATPHGAARDMKGRSPVEVAREFESMLLTQMIGAMRKTVGESGLLQESPQRKVLDGVFDNEMARSLVEAGGLGLADSLAKQIQAEAARESGQAGRLALPVDGAVSSGFGMRTDPMTGEPHIHGGIDVAAAEGTPIRSVRDGVVVFSGERGLAGQLVEVRNEDGSVAGYAHASKRLVAVGDRVEAGDVLATVGATGRTTGPHLHFTIRRNGSVVDPTPWLTPAGLAGAKKDREVA